MSERQPVPNEIGVAVDELRGAAAFLTRLPARWFRVDPSVAPDFRQAARVFPVIGGLIGLAAGIVLVVASALGIPPLVAAVLAVGTTVLITGGLHEDGLADFADSLGGTTTEKKLEIMDDSRIGTYGAVALLISVVGRIAAISAIVAAGGPVRATFALIAAEAVSRAAMVRLWHDLPAARLGGLSNDAGTPDQNAMLVALAVAAVIAIVFSLPAIGLWATILAAALSAAATYGAVRITARTLGGRTGDTIGACQQIAVVAFLVGASAI
ncbi:MAG TPA: adenosylcobinamide-GDP ribazoletransferase [Bauldia sp.]|nr:adenosylcobinamide-GDP ribazoletransferase [Bauldia sp.]